MRVQTCKLAYSFDTSFNTSSLRRTNTAATYKSCGNPVFDISSNFSPYLLASTTQTGEITNNSHYQGSQLCPVYSQNADFSQLFLHMRQCICILVVLLWFTVCLGLPGDHHSALASKHLRGMAVRTGMLQRRRRLLMNPSHTAKRMSHRTVANQNLGRNERLTQPKPQYETTRLTHAGLEFELYRDLQVSCICIVSLVG